VARLQAILTIGHTLKNGINKPTDLIRFSWEKEEIQSSADMKRMMTGIAKIQNIKVQIEKDKKKLK